MSLLDPPWVAQAGVGTANVVPARPRDRERPPLASSSLVPSLSLSLSLSLSRSLFLSPLAPVPCARRVHASLPPRHAAPRLSMPRRATAGARLTASTPQKLLQAVGGSLSIVVRRAGNPSSKVWA